MGTIALKVFDYFLNLIRKPVAHKDSLLDVNSLEKFFKSHKALIKEKFKIAAAEEMAFDFNPKARILIDEFNDFLAKKDNVTGCQLRDWVGSVQLEFRVYSEKKEKPALLKFVDWFEQRVH